MSLTLRKVINGDGNKNHHKPAVYSFSKLNHKKIDSIKKKLEKLIEKKRWRADVKEHPEIKNVFQVLLSEEGYLCLFKVTCILDGEKSHFDLYSKKSSTFSTKDLTMPSLSFGIKALEGVNV